LLKKTFFIFHFSFFIAALASPLLAAPCSKSALTTCLDSACGVNVGMNPAARCQLCGTSGAGAAPEKSGLKSLSVGASSKNTISEKELKSAPSDPGAKYVWATQQCVQKIAGCTADDVSDAYDKLIEQSCKAAGISAEMANLQSAAKKTKTQSACATDIKACLIGEKRCGADMLACESSVDFDRVFSLCATESGGCDEFANAIKTELAAARDASVKSQDNLLASIVKAYQDSRANRLKDAESSCAGGAASQKCVEKVCAGNMKNQCKVGFEAEKSMATLLCKFYDTACTRLK
jgi:hypothetical protein